MPSVTVNAHKINYTSFCKGSTEFNQSPDSESPTLLCIHGLGSSQNFYYAVASQLLDKYNIVLLDTPAYPGVSLDSLAKDFLEVPAALNLSNVVAVGHSMGGMIALKLAEFDHTAGSNIVKKLVLIGPVHPNPMIAEVFTARAEKVDETGDVEPMINTVPRTALAPSAGHLVRGFVRALVASHGPVEYAAMCRVIAGAVSPDYSKITIPTMFIVGDQDTTVPYEPIVKIIHDGVAGETKLVTLKDVGHWHCLEDPEGVSSAISVFV